VACAEDGSAWWQVSVGDTLGWLQTDGVTISASGVRVRVADGPLRLRESPGGAILARLSAGAELSLREAACDEEGQPWLRVARPDGTEGWAAAAFLDLGAAPAAGRLVARVAEDDVRFRAAPGGEILTRLGAGQPLTVLNLATSTDGHSWLQAALPDGVIGWIAAEYLTLGDGSPEPGRRLEALLLPGSRAALLAVEDGRVVRAMPGRAGREGAPTPTGHFRVQAYLGLLRTTIYTPRIGHEWDLPYFVQFAGDYGIHGLPRDPRDGKSYDGTTLGCLQPSDEDAAWIANWLRPGDAVVIHPVPGGEMLGTAEPRSG